MITGCDDAIAGQRIWAITSPVGRQFDVAYSRGICCRGAVGTQYN